MKIDRTNATKGSGRLDVVTEAYLDYRLAKLSLNGGHRFHSQIQSRRTVRAVRDSHCKRRNYEVPHPDFILVSPRGSYVVVVDPKDPREAPNHINALLIERATLLDGQKPRRSRNIKARPRLFFPREF